MKIEQISKDKIQVIFSKEDLEKNKINLHSLMSNSKVTQNLFLSILDFAKKEIGFETFNYEIAIETLALSNSNFILTISRIKNNDSFNRQKLYVSRKKYDLLYSYKFNSFNDFYDFFNIIKLNSSFNKTLYYFNNSFYYISNSVNNTKSSSILLEYTSPSYTPKYLIKNYGKIIW